MLTNLYVKNLALIEEADVEFGPGLNILTGETGAGKSILIGSLNLALGKKMSREMLREHTDTALVELVFQIDNPQILQRLREMEIDAENGQVVISRKFTENRSISKLNGETCTAAQIRRISELLLDIHGQHEHQSLLYPAKQLEILDVYAKEETAAQKEKVAATYRHWQEVKQKLEAYNINEEERLRELSFLAFEIQEIEAAQLRQGEDEELEKHYRRLLHAKQITEGLQQAYALTTEEGGAAELIGRAVRELLSCVSYDEGLQGLCDTASDIEGLFNDLNRELSSAISEHLFSEEDFYGIEKRLDEINRLKAKYGADIDAIHRYLEKQQQRLEELEHFETRKQALLKEAEKAEQALGAACEVLSGIRKSYAKKLAEEIIEGLQQLNFLDVRFELAFKRTESYTANGFDSLAFLISTNPGEPLRELSKVVSGGELSRIMLAIKTILADRDDIDTLIFDEIDTGISGRTAQLVSEKMAKIGKSRQVICITHLPQIAAMADRHFEIQKQVENGETHTHIAGLGKEASVRELARMLGGAKITDRVLENAREMKELAEERRAREV